MGQKQSSGYSWRRLPDRSKNPAAASRPQPVILIVEDEDNLAELLALRLKIKQFATLIASDGHSACRLTEDLLPDLILLDIMLPEMDGWEVCSFIRSHTNPQVAETPIIMLSALSDMTTRYRGQAAGADAFLGKPYDFEKIFTKIDTLLDCGTG
ncbi:MAG: response regulator [Thermodesulfobacteriota bacterium]